MKLKTFHWVIVVVILIVVWIGLMVGLSHKYLVEKDPVPTSQWSPELRPK